MVLVNGLEPLPMLRLQGDCSTIGAKTSIFYGTAWTRTTIRRLTAFRNDLYTTDPNKKPPLQLKESLTAAYPLIMAKWLIACQRLLTATL